MGTFMHVIRWLHLFYHTSTYMLSQKAHIYHYMYDGREEVPINDQNSAESFRKYRTIILKGNHFDCAMFAEKNKPFQNPIFTSIRYVILYNFQITACHVWSKSEK